MTRGTPLPETVTLHVPFRIVKRGGRREMQLPEGATQPRGRWKRMLESGEFATITELARRGRLTVSFVTRVLRLAQLAPDIVEAILEGRQGSQLTLAAALRSVPLEWGKRGRRTNPGPQRSFSAIAQNSCLGCMSRPHLNS